MSVKFGSKSTVKTLKRRQIVWFEENILSYLRTDDFVKVDHVIMSTQDFIITTAANKTLCKIKAYIMFYCQWCGILDQKRPYLSVIVRWNSRSWPNCWLLMIPTRCLKQITFSILVCTYFAGLSWTLVGRKSKLKIKNAIWTSWLQDFHPLSTQNRILSSLLKTRSWRF